MPQYRILRPISHDGERHANGEIVLPQGQAAALVEAGYLAPMESTVDSPRAPLVDAGLSERELALRAALADLDAGDPDRADADLWTKAGAPKLAAVRRHPELADVTPDEVAAAWAALHEA